MELIGLAVYFKYFKIFSEDLILKKNLNLIHNKV